jgi:hypothetical protein
MGLLEATVLRVTMDSTIRIYVQGEHKFFPRLQTFITRKLHGIQKDHMLKCTNVL